MRAVSLLLICILAVGCIAQQPAERVRATAQAQKKLTYRADVRTATFGDTNTAAEAVMTQQGERLRIEYKSPARVVIDDGKYLYQLDPQAKTILRSAAYREPDLTDLLLKNYRAKAAGTAEVAGRRCDVITLTSALAGRPSRKVWIDKATGLMLRSESYDTNGSLLSLTVFRTVDFSPRIEASAFRAPSGWTVTDVGQGHKHYSAADAAKRVGFDVAMPKYVPAGFRLDGIHLAECRGGVPYVHLRYVDGLGSFSVIERQDPCPKCGAAIGGGRGQGRGYRWGQTKRCDMPMTESDTRSVVYFGGVRSMVLGSLPKAELDRIAKSLAPK